jgi:anti-sigma factor RsiW
MLTLPGSLRVFLTLEPCDMRKSFDSLHALVTGQLGENPRGGEVPRSVADRPAFRRRSAQSYRQAIPYREGPATKPRRPRTKGAHPATRQPAHHQNSPRRPAAVAGRRVRAAEMPVGTRHRLRPHSVAEARVLHRPWRGGDQNQPQRKRHPPDSGGQEELTLHRLGRNGPDKRPPIHDGRERASPYAYLRDVLQRLPGMKQSEIGLLVPRNWKPA